MQKISQYFCTVKISNFDTIMKNRTLTFVLGLVMSAPLASFAQDDDMYFVPTKENIAREEAAFGMPTGTYYSGSQRSTRDYNRRSWDTSMTNDSIIDFSAARGVLNDSTLALQDNNNYEYTRRMSRFDDYSPQQAYWDGYYDGQWASPWHSSWYSWYDPWYWDSPWYYAGWHGWYSPWYYSGWYSPWHYGWYGGYGYHGYRHYGGAHYGGSWARNGSYRGGIGVTHHKSSSSSRGSNLGGYRSRSYQGGSSYSSPSLGGSRSYSYGSGSSGGSSYGSSGGSSSSSSYGGSRSSSSGSSSSGGGRSVGGGHYYGGRR